MELDETQQVVARHLYGGLLVLAGPGSGKTASITGRAGRLINKGVDPANLLMVTFSKKAANEMRDRLAALTDDASAERASVYTFHALGDRIIKAYPEQCQRQPGFTIMDEQDTKGLFARILKEYFKVEKIGRLNYQSWLSAYSRLAQDGGRAYESIHAESFGNIMNKHAGIERQDQMNWLWRAFNTFERVKQEQNMVDFNDLLLLPNSAMVKDQGIGTALAKQYPLITVDEAQDTSLVQYSMISSIACNHGNLLMVGDDDQSLYSWRGAHSRNLRQFINDFDPNIAKLERNYRSTTAIVAAAAKHISFNNERLVKSPFSVRDESGSPALFNHQDERGMGKCLIEQLKLRNAEGIPWEQQSILYRKNRIGEVLEPMLLEANIPYEVQGGVKLLERKEIRLALALARLRSNKRDQMAFATLAKGIKGLGDTGLENHFIECEKHHNGDVLTLSSALKKKPVRQRVAALSELCSRLDAGGPIMLVDELINSWGIESHFPNDKDNQLQAREDRLNVFASWIRSAVQSGDQVDDPWGLLKRALIEDPEQDLSEGGRVVLSTFHRSKGLEWDTVHIAGYSDGLVPLQNKQGGIENETEERNGSYTAITRAKNRVYLHHADRLFLGYETLCLAPSRYLNELPHTVMPTHSVLRNDWQPSPMLQTI